MNCQIGVGPVLTYVSHCSSTATLESPFQTQRGTTQITLCPSFLAWITELTNVAKLLKKAYPNNLLLRWCYYDEEETPVRGNLKVVYFVFGAEQCCWFSSHWKQKHHKWQSSFLQYASATRSRRKKLTTDWYRLVYQNYNLGNFFVVANIIGVESTLLTSTSQHCSTLTP